MQRLGPAIDCFLRGVQALQQARSPDADVERVRKRLRHCQRSEPGEMGREVGKRTAVEKSPLDAAVEMLAEHARKRVEVREF